MKGVKDLIVDIQNEKATEKELTLLKELGLDPGDSKKVMIT